jgi:hypothetical protein
MIPENSEPQKVTIEDILRLKRAERPSPEFWGRFEQELRAKQLAAIVEKRPWWVALRVPQIARSLSRFQVPVGAAAVLALSFVVVREYRPLAISVFSGLSQSNPPMESSADSFGKTVASVALPPDQTSIERPVSVAGTTLDTNARVAHVAGSSVRVPSVDEPASVGPGGLMAMIPWAPQTTSVPAEKDPVVLGELSPVHFLPVAGSGREHDFQGRVEIEPVVMPVRMATAENIATAHPALAVVSPREVRRNHILSNLAVADVSEIDRSRVLQVREVLASALDDDRFYDSVRRLGMGGDRLTLKF